MTAPRSPGSWRTRSARLLGAAVLFAVFLASAPPSQAQASTASDPTWSTLSPPTSPPALRGAAAAYDAANQTVVVFGGELPDGALSNQTWVWNGTTWSRVDRGFGSVPPARIGASMAYDAELDQLILFGGESSGRTLLDDTWLWNGASWIELSAPSTPGPRTDAALAPGPDGELVLFGGYGASVSSSAPADTTTPTSATTDASSASSTTSSSTTAVSGTSGTSGTSTSTSTSTAGTTTTTTAPSGISGSSGGSGGRSGSASPAVLDDTWLLESTPQGDDWVRANTPLHPAPTEGAAAAETSTGTVLFGGSSAPPSDPATGLSNRTWVWSGHRWSLVRAPTSPPPSSSGLLVDDPAIGGVVAFGGTGPNGPLGEVWSFSADRWQRLKTSSTPSPRTEAVGVYDAASRQVLVFGGLGATGRAFDSTVVLASQPPVSVPSSPSTTATSTTTTTTNTSSTTRESGGRGSPSTSSSTTRTSTAPSRAGGSASGSGTSASRATEPTSIHPGDVVTLEGHGFAAGARVVVTFEPTHQVVAVTRANGSGRFLLEVTVPDGAAVGHHAFLATGAGPSGPVDLLTPVQVAAYAHRAGPSPDTTASLVALALAFPVLTLVGLHLFDRGRRRSPTD
jgi:hypothetical protein